MEQKDQFIQSITAALWSRIDKQPVEVVYAWNFRWGFFCYPQKRKDNTMNTYTVYHRKTLLNIDCFENAIPKLYWPEDYRLVTSVEAENLEQAYTKTQHFECEWWNNPGVELLAKSRSTSVNDVIIGPDRHVMVVTPVGFADLSQEMGHRILADAEEAFGLRSLILERATLGNWPRPVSIPEFLFWLEDEARLQAAQLYDDILFFDQQETYVRALFGVAMELRAWGFAPALPPWAIFAPHSPNEKRNGAGFTLVNAESVCVERDGEFPLLPAESPHTFGSLQGAAQALAELIHQNGHSLDTIQVHTLEPVSRAMVQTALLVESDQPEKPE